MQRYPPRPRINTCVICRNDFMLAVSAEPRSLATACQAICSSRRCPHRSFRPGAMPIARMTSELRSVAATSAWAEIDDCVARLNDRQVKYSLATAIIKVRMPVPIASQPKIGFSRKAAATNSGTQGISKNARSAARAALTASLRGVGLRTAAIAPHLQARMARPCLQIWSFCTTPAVSITLGNGEVDRVNLGEAGRNTITLGEGAGDEVNVSVLSGLKPDQPFAARSRRAPSPPTPTAAGRRHPPPPPPSGPQPDALRWR